MPFLLLFLRLFILPTSSSFFSLVSAVLIVCLNDLLTVCWCINQLIIKYDSRCILMGIYFVFWRSSWRFMEHATDRNYECCQQLASSWGNSHQIHQSTYKHYLSGISCLKFSSLDIDIGVCAFAKCLYNINCANLMISL